MQLAKCLVKFDTSMENVVAKYNVTPPEIQILRSIHGPQAVYNVVATGMDRNRPYSVELQRLRDDYGTKRLEIVYPGFAPTLPSNLKDIGIDGYADLADEIPVAVAAVPQKPRIPHGAQLTPRMVTAADLAPEPAATE